MGVINSTWLEMGVLIAGVQCDGGVGTGHEGRAWGRSRLVGEAARGAFTITAPPQPSGNFFGSNHREEPWLRPGSSVVRRAPSHGRPVDPLRRSIPNPESP